MTSPTFRTDEQTLSQLPAMELLAKMGWQPLTPAQADAKRRGISAVILEDITREFLRGQTITWGRQTLTLTEGSVEKLVAKLKDLPPDTLGMQAQKIWDKLVLSQSVEQTLESGAKRHIDVRLVDFENPQNNLFHFVPEFVVRRRFSNTKTRRPDIVLFVNGIPLAVIENKKAANNVEEGVSQTVRNQRRDEIPDLYLYAQVLLSVNKNDNRYGTTGTKKKLWSKWREKELTKADIEKIIAAPLSQEAQSAIAEGLNARPNALSQKARGVIEQDYALAGLCKPERLLRMTRHFILFSGSEKTIARFQQVNAVVKTLTRAREGGANEPRGGGVIWHTQGSGKSLTMVMLARALVEEFGNARIVLVTDRVDLDKQIKGTFQSANMEPKRAHSGKELARLINENRAGVITTIINKFENAQSNGGKDESRDVFVLVDEGHRTQYGQQHAQMRRVFPNACLVAFTGTPVVKRGRNTMRRFGKIIDSYTMPNAIKDGVVVPLVYEGRMITPDMNQGAVDAWFKRLTADLTEQQKEDLKKKYARANMLSRLEQVVKMRAFDISEHYSRNFKGTGLKGQLVAPDKATAIKYKAALDSFGEVSSEVLISSTDTRDGHDEVDEGEADEAVVAFWEQMMRRYGNEERYNEEVINKFKGDGEPEIIIVVSKLLTGFDSPRNAVLYLSKTFNESANLLQAIARVNRVLDTEDEGFTIEKKHGLVIDYEGVLKNLDKAVTEYRALAGYEEKDLEGGIRPATELLNDVPQKHGALLDIFKTLDSRASEEEYEQFLRDEEIRDEFYEAYAAFNRALKDAAATACFYDETQEAERARYKSDLKRFGDLRNAVKLRYGEEIDFKQYEKRIEKMLHDNIQASEARQVVPPVQVFGLTEEEEKEVEKDAAATKTAAAKADTIAHNMKRVFTELMDTNPAFYEALSKRLQKIIDDFINKRLSEAKYLRSVLIIVKESDAEQAPPALKGKPHASAFYAYLLDSPLSQKDGDEQAAVDFAAFFADCLQRHKTVEMFKRPNIVNDIRGEVDDFIYDTLKKERGIKLAPAEMDEIQEKLLRIAKSRMGQ